MAETKVVESLYRAIRKIIDEGRRVVSVAANTVLVQQNWAIGQLIVEGEQKGRRKAEYGRRTLESLAEKLTAEYGRGYDMSNLRYMRLFYLSFPIRDALRHELGWTHYRILMREKDPIARYSILHDNKNMFAVKYSAVMPSEEVLRREIEAQKELYRLQMENEGMGKLPPREKK